MMAQIIRGSYKKETGIDRQRRKCFKANYNINELMLVSMLIFSRAQLIVVET